jgi:hypothetical protein
MMVNQCQPQRRCSSKGGAYDKVGLKALKRFYHPLITELANSLFGAHIADEKERVFQFMSELTATLPRQASAAFAGLAQHSKHSKYTVHIELDKNTVSNNIIGNRAVHHTI